ncbi:MAG: ABC transporter substrate-binding protein [Eubacteriales bacterium]
MKKLITVILISSMIMSMTGCAPSETSTTSSSGTATSKNDSEESSGEDAIHSLTVISQFTDGWTRNFNVLTNDPWRFMQGFMYEPLVIFDTYNNSQETMWLAEDIISEPDNKTLTIKVREGIWWSDGEEFNAEDVAFSFTYSKDYPEVDRNGDWGEDGRIDTVEIIDNYTVKIVMKEENRFHRSSIFNAKWMIPEHIYSSITDPSSAILEDPVVTGAFSIVEAFSPEAAAFLRNPTYWMGEELKVDRLVFPQANSNDSALTLLQTGSIDWAHIFIPNIESTYIQEDESRKYWYGDGDAVRLAPNYMTENEGARRAFESVEFKQAMSLTIDRQGIIDAAVFGYLDFEMPSNTGLTPALSGYRNAEADAIMEQYGAYDLDAAKKILEDAGFVDLDGDGFVDHPDGTPIAFEIVSPAGWSDWNNGAVICAQGMRTIGINASANSVDLGMIVDGWTNGDYDVRYSGCGAASDIYKFYYDTIGDQSRVKTPTWWSITQTNYISDEMTDLIASLPNATTDTEVKAVTDQVELYYAENMVNIPLIFSGNWFVYNDSRFTGWATKENIFINPSCSIHDSKILQLLALEPIQ